MLGCPTLGRAHSGCSATEHPLLPPQHFRGAVKAESRFPLTLHLPTPHPPPEQETPLDSDGWEPATGEKGVSLCGGVCLSASL